MRVPLSWLSGLVGLAPGPPGVDAAASLVGARLGEGGLAGRDLRGAAVRRRPTPPGRAARAARQNERTSAAHV